MSLKRATAKVWATSKGKLVKDGDESAEVLVANQDQVIHEDRLSQYEDADKFFEDINPRPKTEAPTRKRVEDADEKPKGKK